MNLETGHYVADLRVQRRLRICFCYRTASRRSSRTHLVPSTSGRLCPRGGATLLANLGACSVGRARESRLAHSLVALARPEAVTGRLAGDPSRRGLQRVGETHCCRDTTRNSL